MKLSNLTKPNKKSLMTKFVNGGSQPPLATKPTTSGIPELNGTNSMTGQGSGSGNIFNPKFNGLMGLK